MNWSELSADLITMIAGQLTETTDFVHFRSVCSSWRSAADNVMTSHNFSSFKNIYIIPLPFTHDPMTFGSSHRRFLAFSWEQSCFGYLSYDNWIAAKLINPITGASMCLPSFRTSSWAYPSTPICSVPRSMAWDHSTAVIMVACTTEAGLFYSRPRNNWFWRQIESMRNTFVRRIVYHLGHFYVLERDTNRTEVIDGNTLGIVSVIPFPEFVLPIEIHLTVSSHKIRLVVQSVSSDSREQFKVFQLEYNREKIPKWIAVTNLGERSFYFDYVHCFSFAAVSCNGLRKNCIYHLRPNSIDDEHESSASSNESSIAVFDMGDHSFEELDSQSNRFFAPYSSRHCVPSWILPN